MPGDLIPERQFQPLLLFHAVQDGNLLFEPVCAESLSRILLKEYLVNNYIVIILLSFLPYPLHGVSIPSPTMRAESVVLCACVRHGVVLCAKKLPII